MISHIVIFWTNPGKQDAADELVAGARKYLESIPGIRSFHVGKMLPSERAFVDQTYRVGLNIQFENKAAEEGYQTHPLHLEFLEKIFKPNCIKVVAYEFG